MWGNLEKDDKWYVDTMENVIEKKDVKILWNVIIQSDKEIKARKTRHCYYKEREKLQSNQYFRALGHYNS